MDDDEISKLIEKVTTETETITELKSETSLTPDVPQNNEQTMRNSGSVTDWSKLKSDDTKTIILKEISDFSPHLDNLTLSTLLGITHWTSVINIGPKGIGKSRATCELLDFLGLDYEMPFDGHVSALAFFEALETDGIVVIDESAQILKNKEVLNMLLSALKNKPVHWINNKKNLTHTFKGIILCNTNEVSRTPMLESVLDRCIINKITITNEKFYEKQRSSINYKPNINVWYLIMEKLGLLEFSKQPAFYNQKPSPLKDLIKNSLELKQYPFKPLIDEAMYSDKESTRKDIESWIVDKLQKSNVKIGSMRTFKHTYLIGSFSYMLLNDFSLIDTFLDSLSSEPIKRADKVKLIAEQDGISVRQAQRKMKEIEDKLNTEKMLKEVEEK